MKRITIATMALAAMLFGAGSAWAGLGDHIITGADGGTCGACHNTQASATLRGWSTAVSDPGTTGWYTRTIGKLCYGCHGNVSVGGSHDVSIPVYANGLVNSPTGDPYVHLYTPGVIWAVDGSAVEDYTTTGMPYTRTPLIDCTTCHNVHNDDGAPFINRPNMGGPAGTTGGLCASCHQSYNAGAVGTANTVGTGGLSLHPTNIALANIPANLDTTILSPIDAALRTTIPGLSGAGWLLGGKLTTSQEGTAGGFSCQTCHAVHGPLGVVSTNDLGIPDLLAINNYPRTVGQPSALCEGCHGAPTHAAPYDTVGTGTDHPIDTNTGRPFYPTGVALPAAWTDGTNHDRAASPFYAAGSPTCSSCHDAHGGLTGTSLLRGPENPANPDGWCFECHDASELIPAYHHSNIHNDAPGNFSALDCGDCHGTGLTSLWSAHNGFWSFAVAEDEVCTSVTPNYIVYQSLCEHCHAPADPTAITGYAASFPATHGNATGSESHVCSNFGTGTIVMDDDSTFNSWLRGNAWPETDGAVSKVADCAGAAVNGRQLICESCHNILDNAAFTVLPGDTLAGGWKMNLLLAAYEDDGAGRKAGADEGNSYDGAQTGDALCRGCHYSGADENSAPAIGAGNYVHYPAAHTVENFSYPDGTAPAPNNVDQRPYGRPSALLLTLLTGACPNRTTADADGTNPPGFIAPGVMSYPVEGELNCDSCHRPHDADPEGLAGGFGYVILENGSTAGNPKTDACDQCHDTQQQCQ
jgi:predicted CXXCH cytochrome family protein